MNFKRYVEASDTWVDSHYIKKTDTDTITPLPAIIYPLAQTATLGIKGQTVQNGTPTSDNPIMPQGTGERTSQLFDNANNIEAYYLDSSTGEYKSTGSTSRTALIKCTAENVYTISAYSRTFRVAFYSSKPTNGTAAIIFYNYDYGSYDTHVQTVTAPQNAQYMAFFCYNSGTEAQTYTEGEIFSTVMINIGATALPYEPYGIKIPISSASTTTPVYLGEVQSTRKIRKVVFSGSADEAWKRAGSTHGYFTDLPNGARTSGATNIISSHYVSATSSADGTVRIGNSKTEVLIYDNYTSVTDFKAYLQQQYAAGTPVTIWYVLENETTGIVNEPLMKIGSYADSISGISIPTTTGANTLDVDTTVAPSEVTATFNGWHPVTSAHERSGGAWD